MAEEIRVSVPRRKDLGPLAAPTPPPTVAGDGTDCVEFPWSFLRVTAGAGCLYTLRIHTYDAGADRWTEDPSERQAPLVGEDYSRYYFTQCADKIDVEFVTLAGGTLEAAWAMA